MKYLFFFLMGLFTSPAFSQFVHRSTLIGTGGVGQAYQGTAVAVSADGNVAVVTSALDSVRGAAWVYLRNGNQWVQAGKKLTPAGFIPRTDFGISVSISNDGSTIAFGGPEDNSERGATWVFVRNGNNWFQQGPKLLGSQTTSTTIYQGHSVALSADGNTLLVGGWQDNGLRGAAWFFTRSGNTWTQQGNKIVGSTGVSILFGVSVALSDDGNTALIGASLLNHGTGFIYKRTGTSWNLIQQITDASSSSYIKIGETVNLSGDGKVAVLGAPASSLGLVWIFRMDSLSQLWIKEQIIAPTGAIGGPRFGKSITTSYSGDTLVIGGPFDNNKNGAVWIFTHSGGIWSQLGTKITSPITGGFEPSFGYSVSLSGDGMILFIGRPGGSAQGAAFVFSDPSVLSTKQEINAGLKFYPNPVKDILYLPENAAINHITVSDLSGKLLLEKTNAGKQINLGGLPSGMYLISIRQKEKVQRVRIVKE